MPNRTVSFILGVMLGAVVSAAWFYGPPSIPALTEKTQTTTPSDSSYKNSESGDLAVSDQKAGGSVTVDSVTVPPPGVWVAVREVKAGELANILGAARTRAPSSNVVVPLARGTVAGHDYAVMLYRDDGDNVFDYKQDVPYIDFDTGERVVEYFKTLP